MSTIEHFSNTEKEKEEVRLERKEQENNINKETQREWEEGTERERTEEGAGGIEGKYFTASTSIKHSEWKWFRRRMNYLLKSHCKMFVSK